MKRDPLLLQSRKITRTLSCSAFLVLLSLAAVPELECRQDEHIALALSQPLIAKWRYESDRMSNLTPASDDRTIYLPLTSGILVALAAADGQLRWKADAGGEFSSAPVADERNVYVATEYHQPVGNQSPIHGTLRAISKETGVTHWMRTLPSPLRGGLVATTTRLFGAASDGRVYAFDKGSGLTVWINQYAQAFSGQPAVFGDRLYIGGDTGTLFALDQNTGRTVWRYRTRAAIQGPIAVANGVIYFGSGDGYVYAFNESRANLLWRHRTGAAVQAVVVVDNGLLAASLDNFAYLLSLRKGSLIWRQLLPGRIAARPITAPDGALFTPLSTDSAIVLGLKDGKPVNTLPLGEDNSSSAAPIALAGLVLVPVPHGLLAFSAPQSKH